MTMPNMPVKEIIKRDGSRVPFEPVHISAAITKAGAATGEFDEPEAQLLTAQVLKVVTHRAWSDSPSVEDIQDIVEQTLINADYFATARAYIVYREQRRRVRDDEKVMIDAISSVDEYLEQSDWRVQANANQGYSLGGLILNVAGKVTANYWLSEVYPSEVGQAHRRGDFHIHDLDMLSGYCAGWSLRTLLTQGFNGVPGKVEAAPPKHMSSAVGQMVNFLGWGTQTPFTNITLDWTCPEDLREQPCIIANEETGFTYGELEDEMALVNRALIEVMTRGDWRGRVFTFPIPTYNITRDFDWDHPNTDALFEMTAKYGIPYFQNFINSDLSPSMVRSMCCRLQLDLRELLNRGGGLFGSAEQTGSLGVVTLNCARLGYLARGDKAAFYQRLDALLELGRTSLEIKRKTVQRCIDNELLPYTKRYLGKLDRHFSTIGINGVNECIRNFTGDKHDITDEWGQQFALDLLEHIRERMVVFQEETGNLYNLEASPAEGTTYRFAREDKSSFPDILQAGTEDAPYYTNSTQLPVGWTDDPFQAMEHQEPLQALYTGGTVFHMFLGEPITSAEACKNLVRRSFERFRLPYLTITPTFSICPRHGYLPGEHRFCPKCDAELLAQKHADRPDPESNVAG
jgi:ribonucleoside-triphosphate reductase